MSMFNFNRLRKSLRPSTTPGPSPPHSPASFYSPGHTSPTFKESDFPAGYSALQSSNFFPSPRHTQDSPYYPTVTPGPAPHKRSPSQPFARVPATSPELVLDIPDGSFTDNFSQDMLHSRNPHRADKRNSNRRSIQKSDRTRRAPATILPSVIEDIVPVVKYRSTSNPSSSSRPPAPVLAAPTRRPPPPPIKVPQLHIRVASSSSSQGQTQTQSQTQAPQLPTLTLPSQSLLPLPSNASHASTSGSSHPPSSFPTPSSNRTSSLIAVREILGGGADLNENGNISGGLRWSQYSRAGEGGLVRQDSATLPVDLMSDALNERVEDLRAAAASGDASASGAVGSGRGKKRASVGSDESKDDGPATMPAIAMDEPGPGPGPSVSLQGTKALKPRKKPGMNLTVATSPPYFRPLPNPNPNPNPRNPSNPSDTNLPSVDATLSIDVSISRSRSTQHSPVSATREEKELLLEEAGHGGMKRSRSDGALSSPHSPYSPSLYSPSRPPLPVASTGEKGKGVDRSLAGGGGGKPKRPLPPIRPPLPSAGLRDVVIQSGPPTSHLPSHPHSHSHSHSHSRNASQAQTQGQTTSERPPPTPLSATESVDLSQFPSPPGPSGSALSPSRPFHSISPASQSQSSAPLSHSSAPSSQYSQSTHPSSDGSPPIILPSLVTPYPHRISRITEVDSLSNGSMSIRTRGEGSVKSSGSGGGSKSGSGSTGSFVSAEKTPPSNASGSNYSIGGGERREGQREGHRISLIPEDPSPPGSPVKISSPLLAQRMRDEQFFARTDVATEKDRVPARKMGWGHRRQYSKTGQGSFDLSHSPPMLMGRDEPSITGEILTQTSFEEGNGEEEGEGEGEGEEIILDLGPLITGKPSPSLSSGLSTSSTSTSTTSASRSSASHSHSHSRSRSGFSHRSKVSTSSAPRSAISLPHSPSYSISPSGEGEGREYDPVIDQIWDYIGPGIHSARTTMSMTPALPLTSGLAEDEEGSVLPYTPPPIPVPAVPAVPPIPSGPSASLPGGPPRFHTRERSGSTSGTSISSGNTGAMRNYAIGRAGIQPLKPPVFASEVQGGLGSAYGSAMVNGLPTSAMIPIGFAGTPGPFSAVSSATGTGTRMEMPERRPSEPILRNERASELSSEERRPSLPSTLNNYNGSAPGPSTSTSNLNSNSAPRKLVKKGKKSSESLVNGHRRNPSASSTGTSTTASGSTARATGVHAKPSMPDLKSSSLAASTSSSNYSQPQGTASTIGSNSSNASLASLSTNATTPSPNPKPSNLPPPSAKPTILGKLQRQRSGSSPIPSANQRRPPARMVLTWTKRENNRETLFPETPRSFSPLFSAEVQMHRSHSEGAGMEQVLMGDFPTSSVLDQHPPLPNRIPSSHSQSQMQSQTQSQYGQGSRISGPRPRPPSTFERASMASSSPAMSHKKATSDASSLNTRLVTPSSPRFLPLSVRWKGLTYEAAQWTLTSSELQDIARAAIRKSAGPSSIRILPPKIYNQDLPMEVEKLEQMREEAKQKYKAQVRRRRVLLRSLSLYCDGSDAAAAVRYTEDLAEVTASCDKLAEEIFQATDQLAQINRLRDVHYASALAMSLQKLNKSLLRQTAENNDLKTKIASLEAEREEAWGMAESLASEMQELEFKLERDGVSTPSSSGLTNSRPSSRVSAARKTSMRASKASLRLSTSKKSVRSSMASSMRRASSTSLLRTPPSAFVTHGHTADVIPPVPPMPMPGRFVSHDWPLTTQSSLMMTPSTSNHALSRAQDDVMEMLGITLHELGHGRGRSQSVSQSQTTPVESNPPSSFSYYFESPGSRVSRPSSDGFAPLRVRRHSISSMPSQAPLYSPAQNAGDQSEPKLELLTLR